MRLHFIRPHARHRDRIGPHVEGSLRGQEQERFSAHLAGCVACATEVEQIAALRSALQSLPDPVARRSFRLTAAMLAESQAAVAPARARVSRLTAMNGVRLTGAAAAVALAVAVVVDVAPREGGESTFSASAPQADQRQASAPEKGAGASEGTAAATVAAPEAPRAASAPSADTGALSGAEAETSASPTPAAASDSSSAPVADPPVAAASEPLAVQQPGRGVQDDAGSWGALRILQLALVSTIAAAISTMVVARFRRSER